MYAYCERPKAQSLDREDMEKQALGERKKGRWQVWVAAAMSLGCLILALRDVNLGEAWAAFAHVSGWWLLLALGSVGVTLVSKAARWRVLFVLQRAPSLRRSLSAQSIGMLVNAVVPARLGELARAYLIGEAEAESKAYALGTIALEKVTDLFFMSLSLLVLLAFMPLPVWLPARQTALVVGTALVVILIVDRQNELILRSVRWLSRLAPARARDWLARQAELGLASLQVLRRPRVLAGLLGWSIFVWVISSLTNWLVWKAMGLTLPLWAALLLVVVLQAGVVVPASPGRIGVFQYLTILCLSLFTVKKEIAFDYSVLLHLITYGPVVGLGAYYLWREKITWQKLEEAARRIERRLLGSAA